LVRDVRTFAGYYVEFALGGRTQPLLEKAFADLAELKSEVTYPLLLELSHDHASGVLPSEDFAAAVRLIESYILRRAVCDIPTNTMKDTFRLFGKSLDKTNYLESIRASFQLLTSRHRFPGDDEFRRELVTSDLYSRGRTLRVLFDRYENHDRKERVPTREYTIEHVMPQNKNLSKEWREELGADWKSVQERLVHTLGNLTLTGYNSEYSDKPFSQKRDMPNGFKHSPLRLNAQLGQLDRWDAEAVQDRADQLAEVLVGLWAGPGLDSVTLDAHRPKNENRLNRFTIDDHPKLTDTETRMLFEALRAEVFALNPDVTEEFLKQYVAYKVETNFVDVVPQKARLRLFLNMPFAAVNDPLGRCRNVADVGHWGNGEIEVRLSNKNELPIVMDLIRQSLEYQTSGEEDWDD
jgi:predicted transport protein